MTVKHNCKHPDRSKSHYPQRLAARGLAKAPRMEPLDVLRRRQEKRVEAGLPPWPTRAADAVGVEDDE